MSDTVVSIILLNYNTLSFTEQCIKSIISNIHVDYEIIIVLNDSHDRNKMKEFLILINNRARSNGRKKIEYLCDSYIDKIINIYERILN